MKAIVNICIFLMCVFVFCTCYKYDLDTEFIKYEGKVLEYPNNIPIENVKVVVFSNEMFDSNYEPNGAYLGTTIDSTYTSQNGEYYIKAFFDDFPKPYHIIKFYHPEYKTKEEAKYPLSILINRNTTRFEFTDTIRMGKITTSKINLVISENNSISIFGYGYQNFIDLIEDNLSGNHSSYRFIGNFNHENPFVSRSWIYEDSKYLLIIAYDIENLEDPIFKDTLAMQVLETTETLITF